MCRDCTPIVYRFLFSLCRNENLAEELTAETLYQAFLHIDKFRGECKPETWLCQIAKNTLYKETKRMRKNTSLADFEFIEAENTFLDALQDKEQALNIHKHLHNLGEPYKEIFMLRIFGELSFREIADVCGKTETWAKVTFYRAKNKLIEGMEEKNENQL